MQQQVQEMIITLPNDPKDATKYMILIDCIQALHISIDELLLSAMTLCKYSLPNDQPAVTARCQVVLREMKNLINELVDVDFNNMYTVTKDALKLPIKPSNVNILIDVLKDALYVLETNTNTALLALLIHCCSNSISPVDVLTGHLGKTDGEICSCGVNSLEDITDNCQFVKEFDLYNERLLQIGNFAVSCSSDSNRILSLRSGLMNLEAYDPYLVPALTVSSRSFHSLLLVDLWKKEVIEIIHNVYLIVDPMAFSQVIEETILSNHISKKNRSSLRIAVLNRHKGKPLQEQNINSDLTKTTGSFMDSKTTLQITEILDQINDISCVLSKTDTVFDQTRSITTVNLGSNRESQRANILTININETYGDTSKRVWNIPVSVNTGEVSSDSASADVSSSSSQPSDVTTWERISDLDLLENRLSHLKSLYCETDV
ncbi:Serendipity locus protein alpha [Eumeta japonica]|uniref:Serendipity locus protein alpha n=1 Tax=Eumeta variegata TaxID=151549 RepID=A0A4C1V0U6_EUMVA|nr:Serendipity locus protein alpha [Eumeta japonica]